ncbi:MAG TPA: NACHT domain-containing protein, partial [Ktedonobacteraceae bacterium]|nr:NACHT domain-containing protein [Ktedonobacteraceae bacterium]
MEEKKYPPNYKLRQARELKGWTQKDVADHIDLPDARTLRRWESGDAVPSLRYRTRLCEVFQMGPVELGFISEPPAPLAAKHEAPAEPVVSVATSAAGSPFTIQTLTSFDKTVSTPNYWNRQHLLRKVFNFWIKDVLEPSLAQSPRLLLVLQEEAGAIANPWRHVVQSSRQASPLFVPGTALLQVYDNACGELMLLGETGSGKTTLLLELARDLLQRAFEQEIHPVPVIFNLTSWPEKRLPIAEWLIEELCSKYQVPRRVGQEWVEHDYILPLIDGFDGVSSPARRECLEQINIYRQLHGLVPFVLCSRKTEYYEQMKPVLLQQAVCIQALTPQQIEGYLLGLGEPMGGLLFAFQDDRDLHQLINTPHMLQILVCAYRDQPVDTLKKLASAELRRAHVLTTYVEYTLNQRNPVPSYSPQQSIRWLTYLARQMKKHCQGEFQLDHLQVDWLSTGWLQRVCSGAFAALRIMLLSGMFLGCMETLLHRV